MSESTPPVLEAAHIRPYGIEGPHDIRNGLMLRCDMHKLFDQSPLTVTPDLRLEVSTQIREQYSNGKLYYRDQGSDLRSVPTSDRDRPDPEFLSWHNDNVFRP